jgi:hypothetical protein
LCLVRTGAEPGAATNPNQEMFLAA